MKRYIIIIFAGLLLAASCGKEPVPSNGNGQVKPASGTISGSVVGNDGKALAGVIVSDGLNCVKTSSDGTFSLNSDLENTDYVYVSTPKDYSAPVENGIAVFWKFLKDLPKGSDGKYRDVKFTLNKNPNPERFVILFYGDPQPRSSGAGYDKLAYHALDCCNDMYKDMKEYVDAQGGVKVYGIGLGDIVHRAMDLIPRYKNGMESAGVVTYSVLGNHDHDPENTVGDRDAARTFESHLGPVNYSFDLGDFHIICLDDMIVTQFNSDGTISDECATGLTDEIWQWFQNDLALVPTTTPLMICAHSPMFRRSGGKETSGKHLADVRQLVSRYPKVHHWAGHHHSTFNYAGDPVIESHTVTRVTGELWTNEYIGSNGTPRGYIPFQYDHGEYSWKFKPIIYQTGSFTGTNGGGGKQPSYQYRDWDYDASGKAVLKSTGKVLDDSYQMQAFAPGTYGDDYLYVNIFLWDEQWSTPKFTSSATFQTMKRVTDKKYMYAYNTREIREFYNTYNTVLAAADYSFSTDNTDSMFRVFVADLHGSGTVSVNDRFGNTYNYSISW